MMLKTKELGVVIKRVSAQSYYHGMLTLTLY